MCRNMGSGSGDRQWSENPVGFVPNATLEEALGEQGHPMTYYLASKYANPYYDKSGTYKEYSENCQRCIVAFEARCRGYDVIAQGTYPGDISGEKSHILPDGVRYHYWMYFFKGAKPVHVGAMTTEKTKSKLESQMKAWGNGSRAVMQLKWYGNGAHVINVVCKNGKILYYDAQIGKQLNAEKLYKTIEPNITQLVRVDNLKFSDKAKDAVMRKS